MNICEFSSSAGIDSMWIWFAERPDLPLSHALNLPRYSDDKFFKLVMSSTDGHSKRDMVDAAGKYGFYNYHFINAYHEWLTRNKTITTSPY